MAGSQSDESLYYGNFLGYGKCTTKASWCIVVKSYELRACTTNHRSFMYARPGIGHGLGGQGHFGFVVFMVHRSNIMKLGQSQPLI